MDDRVIRIDITDSDLQLCKWILISEPSVIRGATLRRHERYIAVRDLRHNEIEFIERLAFDAEQNDRAIVLKQKFWDLQNRQV
jgi:hypothetical protein